MMPKNTKFKKNEKGNVLIDSLVAIGIIAIVAYTSISGITQIERLMASIDTKQVLGSEVNELIESIRNNLESYKLDYRFVPDGTSVYANTTLDTTNLPMAWDAGFQAPVAQCATCRGRYGFVIQPYEKFRGLFLVTIAVTHTDWASPKNFQFVVTTK